MWFQRKNARKAIFNRKKKRIRRRKIPPNMVYWNCVTKYLRICAYCTLGSAVNTRVCIILYYYMRVFTYIGILPTHTHTSYVIIIYVCVLSPMHTRMSKDFKLTKKYNRPIFQRDLVGNNWKLHGIQDAYVCDRRSFLRIFNIFFLQNYYWKPYNFNSALVVV